MPSQLFWTSKKDIKHSLLQASKSRDYKGIINCEFCKILNIPISGLGLKITQLDINLISKVRWVSIPIGI